ncbi:GGDEF domain-containing protein [Tenuibacillus multivorans]|uniref:Diguanylate cyclase n=1 Tax=Tenuibacillus multivorans TaxID=237069 RepID=A0A1H0AZI6_9BACI|nr:diguanylate cyclase [Tenuibacillus multivorans]GEL77598.1 GGDEF domain-containing protein [Tenuibacillus multivorans]SDN38824.1 diguanylate cyclase [Tenuibacillus multivorans]
MIDDLIMNICLLITFIFFWHQLFTTRRLTYESPLWVKFSDGFLAGVLGIILMRYSIYVNDITILDLRHVPIALVAYYGGLIPSLVGAVIITIGRYIIDVNFSSHVALFMMLFIAIGSGFISNYVKAIPWKKWLILLIYGQAMFSIALYIVTPDYSQVLNIAILHIIFTLVGGMLAFYFLRYVRRNSELFLKYREFSRKDPLTDLFNVRTFYYYYENFLKQAKENNQSMVLMLLDIDHFKKINDTYGHMSGDEVLKQLGDLFKHEAGRDAIISRNGGEEFSILYLDKSVKKAEKVAENIRKRVEHTIFKLPHGHSIQLTISIGMAFYDRAMTEDHILFHEADEALYRAKNAGRNNIEIFDQVN